MKSTKLDKEFKNYDELIELLRYRNLQMSDLEFAYMALRSCSYYDLVNGYKECFMIKADDGFEHFKDNVSIEDLYSF